MFNINKSTYWFFILIKLDIFNHIRVQTHYIHLFCIVINKTESYFSSSMCLSWFTTHHIIKITWAPHCYALPMTINLYIHLELYNKIAINRKQRKIYQNFQNAMHFPFLHYTSKNEKKGHECCQKKTKP
jgi:hypothetical protein